jgi:hypothetical protein
VAARAYVEIVVTVKRLRRAAQRATDAHRIWLDAEIRDLGRGWEHPELLLEDDDLEALDMRALGRTLEEIDDLPTR